MAKRFFIILCVCIALTTPAMAQFPPPGIYNCVTADGAAFGTLTLLVAGDYDLKSDVVAGGTGQVASAGPSVNALTGPLADIHLTGSFTTDDRGEAVFIFDTDKGRMQCSLPPL